MSNGSVEKREGGLKSTDILIKNAALPGKWLTILFWLIIPSAAAGLLGSDLFVGRWPGMYIPSEILAVACNLVYAVVLFRLISRERLYLDAGGFMLAAILFRLLSLVVHLCGADAVWSSVIIIPCTFLSLIGGYKEYTAHANLIGPYNYGLAAKWRTLCKWYVAIYAVVIASALLTIVIPLVGMIIMLAAMLGTVVISILKLVYLYKTASILRSFARSAEEQK